MKFAQANVYILLIYYRTYKTVSRAAIYVLKPQFCFVFPSSPFAVFSIARHLLFKEHNAVISTLARQR